MRAHVCICACVSRALGRLEFEQKGTAASQQAEMTAVVLHCTVVTGLSRVLGCIHVRMLDL